MVYFCFGYVRDVLLNVFLCRVILTWPVSPNIFNVAMALIEMRARACV